MSSARRSLLTATAAGTLLGALWFVPSANATQDTPARTQPSATATTQARVTSAQTSETSADSANSGSTEENTELADTGSIDTTPYVVGGTLFLTLGAGFVVYSVRRERLGF
ncbi:LPXTG cell wall anchor domain-containing protein [Streptomyces sp. NPDC006476]|uniref:LPXTG cell wall anchor domain-containing protein n=1 Tax=Streptomyces sp. NPDC006476 TaxID=3157175 RepID=UPI0033A715D3